MDALDFSALSDDQLVTLIRAAIREAVDRHPAVAAAAEAATIDEQERARLIAEAGRMEAAALRAAERERIAREARERVRAEHDRAEAEIQRLRAREAGDKARDAVMTKAENSKQWLRRAGDLVGRDPSAITLLLIDTRHGRRVMINEGADRYATDHLADWSVDGGQISTIRALIKAKPQIAALAAEFASRHPDRQIVLIGAEQPW